MKCRSTGSQALRRTDAPIVARSGSWRSRLGRHGRSNERAHCTGPAQAPISDRGTYSIASGRRRLTVLRSGAAYRRERKSVHVEPLDTLAGYGCDQLKVLVAMQNGEVGELCCGCEQEVRH